MTSLSSSGVSSSVKQSLSAPSAAFADLPKTPVSVAVSAPVPVPDLVIPENDLDLETINLDGLNINLAPDVEHNVFEFANPIPDPNQNVSFYLVGTVRALEDFPVDLVEKHMVSAWKPRFGMEVTEIEPNLYLFRFNHRVDINKVSREGPWRFKDYVVATKEVQENVYVPKDQLVMASFWVQVRGLPSRWIREDLVRFTGSLVGHVLEVDATVRKERMGDPEFARVRVEIDTSRRLLRGTNIVVQGIEIPVAFKYERLFNFCYYCGTVDHILENCVEAVKPGFNMANCLYGDWLRGFPPRPRPWIANRWAPMQGSASNPFMPRMAGIPPGFRALAPAAPPPALPMPYVREALPPPPGPLVGNSSTPMIFEQVDNSGHLIPETGEHRSSCSTYKKRDPKPRGTIQELTAGKEADGDADQSANGKRRRGGGSSLTMGDPNALD